MTNAGRMFVSVVAGGFVFLTGLSHASAYESGDLMCHVIDEFPQDGIQFGCLTAEGVWLLQATVYGGPIDAQYFSFIVHPADRGEACNGTVNCNIAFDTAEFYDVPPGTYVEYIPKPSWAIGLCYCN